MCWTAEGTKAQLSAAIMAKLITNFELDINSTWCRASRELSTLTGLILDRNTVVLPEKTTPTV